MIIVSYLIDSKRHRYDSVKKQTKILTGELSWHLRKMVKVIA